MPTYSTGYNNEYIPDWLQGSVLGAQTEEQGRYQAGLQPYRQQAEYYEPGGEYSRQMPSYLYSSFIQPFVGGTGGGLRNLFSTTKAGQISMRAARDAELMRGQQYASAMGALGEATQRYPMMPNLVSLQESGSYSRPAYSWEGDQQNPNDASGGGAGGGGGGGSSGGGGSTGSSSTGGGTSGGGSTGGGGGALLLDSNGNYYWSSASEAGPNNYNWGMSTYVGGWSELQAILAAHPGLNISNMPTTNVDPNTGGVTEGPPPSPYQAPSGGGAQQGYMTYSYPTYNTGSMAPRTPIGNYRPGYGYGIGL